jgi:hypothetical protein
MDELRIGQLTKEMVAEELRRLGDPCAKAAEVVLRTLEAALQAPAGGAEAARVIEDAVKGAMTAVLLADQSLARGAIQVLEAVVEAASRRQLDPTEAMSAALRGLADLRRFVDPERLDEMRREIDGHYMGVGEYFDACLREPLSPAPTPRP